jgi:predicted RNA-binding protein with PIN domain
MGRLIVDGMNVVGSRPDGWWRDRRGAMRSLAQRLGAYAAAEGDHVTLVVDGRPFEIEAPSVEVVFAPAPGRDAADDEIVRLVGADSAPDELTIVTSDRTLAERVRKLGASVTASGGFRRRLDDLV